MNKASLLVAAAISLASCGGSQPQNQSADNNAATDSQPVAAQQQAQTEPQEQSTDAGLA